MSEDTQESAAGADAPDHSAIGSMSLGSSGFKNGGTRIDEWTFYAPFDRAENAANFKVVVYMRKHHGNSATGKPPTIDFQADCRALPNGFLRSSDIEQLRQAVEAALREQAIMRSGVQWENWLEVVVHRKERSYGSPVASEELSIEYRTLLRGRHPEFPDKDYTINFNRVAVPFPKPKKAGEKSGSMVETGSLKGFMGDGRADDAEYAYIPDTPENRAALDQLITSLKLLGTRLSEFLGQDNITQAVSTLQSQLKLLSA